MKRKLLPLAVAAAMGVSGMAVAGEGVNGPKPYGKIKVGFGLFDTDFESPAATDDERWRLESYASRFGVKGDSALGDTCKVFYKYEWEVDVDDNDGDDDLKVRNRYVGLSFGNAGSVKVGHYDTPMKVAQGKIDQFNDFTPDIKGVTQGEQRGDNQINYTSAKIADMFTASVSIMPGEEAGGDDGFADSTSLSAALTPVDGLYLALAIDSDVGGMDTTRFVGQWSQDQFNVGGLIEMSEEADGNTEYTATVITGAFKVAPKTKLKGQIGMMEEDTGAATTDTTEITFGAEHKLGKKTSALAFISTAETDDVSETTELVVGLKHSF